jgi:DNA invertase Pin-like site-specific DNA recombinase
MATAAAYLRKSSSEGQTADSMKSVNQQLDEIRTYAASKGWTLDERYVYKDDEISGEEWVKRPGYQALRNALIKPPFVAVIVWEQSRFGRDTARQLMAIAEITDAGVACWSVNGNRELRAGEITTVVTAWKGEADNEETRARVIRALDAKFKAGYAAGGRSFGYDLAKVPGADKAVRRIINPVEAAVVRKAFALAAQGWGYTRIAKEFTRRGIKPPVRITEAGRARRTRKSQELIDAGHDPLPEIKEGWSHDGLYELLNRELYKGWAVRGRTKRIKRGGTKTRLITPDRVERRFDPALVIVTETEWDAAHARLAENSAKFLRRNGKMVGKPESFKGRHLLSNIARCAVCGGTMHAVARGRNLRLTYVCKTNRMSGSCLNASGAPADELHAAIIRGLRETYTPEKFEAYLAERAGDKSEVDARHHELTQLVDVKIPDLDRRQERLVDAIENGILTNEQAKKRAGQIRDEREVAEARRDELQAWAYNAAAGAAQAEELAAKWPDWAQALEADAVLARQVLSKCLASAPIYVMPGAEKRTWFFIGLASYEGFLRGAVRPGFIATYADDDQYPLVERGAAPESVRQALYDMARREGGNYLPTIRQADGVTSRTNWDPNAMVPQWARPRADRGQYSKEGPRRKLPAISGASGESLDAGAKEMAPHTPQTLGHAPA